MDSYQMQQIKCFRYPSLLNICEGYYFFKIRPREASEMFQNTNSLRTPCFRGGQVHSLKTQDKVLRYGENNQVEFSEHPTVVQRGNERAINIYAAIPNVAQEQHEDKELIKFFVQCFDRPAFQDRIYQEGRMEDFDKAIEDTIIALNTGALRTRDGSILKKQTENRLL